MSERKELDQEQIDAIRNPNDPKYLGVPNISFSLTKESDPREILFVKQRLERGFDNSETWSFCDTAANFILPRLKAFKEAHDETVVKDRYSLHKKIDHMIEAFQIVVDDETHMFAFDPEKFKKYKRGMKAFSEHFLGLWW